MGKHTEDTGSTLDFESWADRFLASYTKPSNAENGSKDEGCEIHDDLSRDLR